MNKIAQLILIAAASVAAAGADTGRTDYDYDAPEPGSYKPPIIKQAADGALLDSSGNAVRLAGLTRGRITVMSFIYTRCAAARACPYATGVLMQLHHESAKDPALASKLETRFTSTEDALNGYRQGDGYVLYTDLTTADTRKLAAQVDALADVLSKVAPLVVQN